jgi:hypothetical protein
MPSSLCHFSGRNGCRSTITAELPASLPPALVAKAPWVVSSQSVTTSECARGPWCSSATSRLPAWPPPAGAAGSDELLYWFRVKDLTRNSIKSRGLTT